MKNKKQAGVLLLCLSLLMALLTPVVFQGESFAQSSHRINIRKVTNHGQDAHYVINDDTDIIYNTQLRGVEGASFRIWKVTETDTLEELNQKSLPDLGEALQTVITDSDGRAVFENLEDGYYYIRETTGPRDAAYRSGISTPVLLQLPYEGTLSTIDINFKPVPIPPPPPPPEESESTPPPPPGPGGEKFRKVDKVSYDTLEGAEFVVTKKETDSDGKTVYTRIQREGKDYIVRSDAKGEFEVNGLEPGEYYLIEIKALNTNETKYRPLSEPLRFEVSRTSYDDDKVIAVYNQEEPKESTEESESESTPGKRPEESTPGKTPPPPKPSTPGTTPPRRTTPSTTTPSSDSPRSRVQIPKTGDIQIYLYSITGLAFAVMGTYLYLQARKEDKESGRDSSQRG